MVALLNEALLRAMIAARGLGRGLREERGQGLMEYAMLSGLIAAAIGGVGALVLTGAIQALFDNIAACVSGDDVNCF